MHATVPIGNATISGRLPIRSAYRGVPRPSGAASLGSALTPNTRLGKLRWVVAEGRPNVGPGAALAAVYGVRIVLICSSCISLASSRSFRPLTSAR